jgi:hypothetical protein
MSGCGSSDTEGESRLETQQMLDSGDYTGVITKLEATATTDSDYIALGAAYMGKAGLSLSDIVNSLTDSSASDSTFSGFVTSIASSSSSTALTDLDTAISYYNQVVDNCSDANLSNSEKDICLYVGLSSTSSAAVTIDLIAGDISTFGDGGSDDEKLTASTCAMNYAFDRTNNVDCNVTQSADVNFTIINKIYSPLVVTVNGDVDTPDSPYYYLMNDINQTVLTKDFCLLNDFTRYEDINAIANLYACPVNETPSATELTTAGVLVDVLNNGIDSFSGAATEEMQGDIDEFKCELLGDTYTGSACAGDIAEQNIIDYLNSQNN